MEASITDNGNTKPTMMDMVLEWRDKHITDRQMTIILALFIGFFASVAAFILHFIIKEIQVLLTAGFTTVTYNWLYLVFPVIGICEICRERQHLTRHHAHSLRHIVKTVTAEAPQLLDIGHRIGHNHRVRRIGRCRGTYRAHRLVYRFKPRAAVQDGQQDPYAACGLWRRCRHCRHLQGSDSRTCVHP